MRIADGFVRLAATNSSKSSRTVPADRSTTAPVRRGCTLSRVTFIGSAASPSNALRHMSAIPAAAETSSVAPSDPVRVYDLVIDAFCAPVSPMRISADPGELSSSAPARLVAPPVRSAPMT